VIPRDTKRYQSIPNKSYKMSAINYDLFSEIIFTNDTIFNKIDINNAKIISCICKNARINKNIKLSFDRDKAYKYFDKIFDIIIENLMYKRKEEYMKREELNKIYGDEYSITSQLEEVISDLKKENINVLYGFRELIVLEFREFIYNYENCKGDSSDIKYNLDYCDQYNLVVNHFGFYEYYEAHTYDPKHFVLKQGSLYDFASA
jgi:hypothetical protein